MTSRHLPISLHSHYSLHVIYPGNPRMPQLQPSTTPQRKSDENKNQNFALGSKLALALPQPVLRAITREIYRPLQANVEY